MNWFTTALKAIAEVLPKIKRPIQLAFAIIALAIAAFVAISGRFPVDNYVIWLIVGALVVSFIVFPESFRVIPQIAERRRPGFILMMFFGFLIWVFALIFLLQSQLRLHEAKVAQLACAANENLLPYPQAALKVTDLLLKLDPEYAHGYWLKGSAFWNMGQCENALNAFIQGEGYAVEADVKNRILQNKASALICLRHYDQARPILDELIKTNPQYMNHRLRMGVVFLNSPTDRDFSRAREEFQLAYEREESDLAVAFAAVGIGVICLQQRDCKAGDGISYLWHAVCRVPRLQALYYSTDDQFIYERTHFSPFLAHLKAIRRDNAAYADFLQQLKSGIRKCA